MASDFECDTAKDEQNYRKHGLSFAEAQLAVLDPARVIARDLDHSRTEQRFYCIGQVADGIVTVRFTCRGRIIRIIGAGYWRRGKMIYETQRKILK